jgi:phospholipase/carboxylesterase
MRFFNFFKIFSYVISVPFLLHAQTGTDSLEGFRYQYYVPSSHHKTKPGILFLLHGYGSNEMDLFAFNQTLPSEYIMVSVRAPYKLPGGGFSWYELSSSGKEMKHNVKEAISTHSNISRLIRNLILKFNADTNRVVVMGYSQGAIMTWMQLLDDNKVKAGIILSGYLPPEFDKPLKITENNNEIKKILLAHGYSDNVIPFTWCEQTLGRIKKLRPKWNITEKFYEMPHAISGKELIDIRAFLENLKKVDK